MVSLFVFLVCVLWFIGSFLLFFKVWDLLGPVVLNISASHVVQSLAMLIVFLVIYLVPVYLFWNLMY